MKHDPQEFERTTMPEALPRPEKRVAGRTPTSKTPVTVRGHHVMIEAHHREYVRERLGQKLAKFAPSIERIYVRLEDLNGPKGGVDHECRIEVVLSGLGLVVVKQRHADVIAAFDLAADHVETTLQHHFGRVREAHVAAQRRSEQRRRAALPAILEEPRSRP